MVNFRRLLRDMQVVLDIEQGNKPPPSELDMEAVDARAEEYLRRLKGT